MTNTVDSLWARLTKGEPDECWEWPGARSSAGYGQIRIRGKLFYTHRLSWEATNGPITDGLFVLHKCDNPSCANPAHLWLGTDQDNKDDMNRKGRNGLKGKPGRRGTTNNMAKLTEAIVLEARLRAAQGETATALADEYGVTGAAMCYALRGDTWPHVPMPHEAELSAAVTALAPPPDEA